MRQNLLKTCVPLGTLLLLSGCIDNKYDLSDIDKTTQVNVNDLVIPVNVDAIKLDDIISLDDDSKIKIVNVNGKEVYAVTQEGEISSDDIVVNSFTAEKPQINPAYATFKPDMNDNTRASMSFKYKLDSSQPQDVAFTASNVDKSVKKITALEFEPLKITMDMTTSGLTEGSTLILNSITFDFLKGLTIQNLPQGYVYDDVKGLLTVNNLPNDNGHAKIEITAIALDLNKADASLINQEFVFDSEVGLNHGDIDLIINYDGATPTPMDQIDFTLNTDVNELVATYFSGKIEYNLDGDNLNIEPVSLSDLPDFLSDKETNLLLANPQIYLNLNNPVANYKLGFETGLQITSVRPNIREVFDPEEKVVVGYNHGLTGPYNFVISPTMPRDVVAAYKENLKPVEFSSLSKVLAGDGLPESIEINLIDPKLPPQDVDRFKLGSSIDGVEGKYEFLAPLALKNGSVIIYSKTDDGWSSDDLDKLTIKTLAIEANAFSDLPLSAKLNVYPLDKEGNRIPNVNVTPAEIKAKANGEKLTLTVTGEIRDLDGIQLQAVVNPGSEEALSPDQTIRLENIRAKVSGYYLTDFE